MANQKPRPGISGNTLVLSARVAEATYSAVATAAGGESGIGAWLRRQVELALTGKQGPGAAQAAGYVEGKRQGWSHANAAFRRALEAAAAELRK